MDEVVILDKGGILFVGAYLVALLGLGVWGRLARKEKSLNDFYLGGRSFGPFVLFMTLFATQYSGNTLIGYAGRAYREGFQFIAAPMFMMMVIGGFLFYGPKLYRLSASKGYVTTSDFIQDRYGYRPLSLLTSALGMVALCNYILTNLLAMGLLVETASGGRFVLWEGIIALSFVMVLYETLGGMRGVAWTDVVQGVLLLVGCAVIFLVLNFRYDAYNVLSTDLKANYPSFWEPPTWRSNLNWLSTLILLGFSISVYPHAVQRIYAARSESALRRSLQVMAAMPIVTTFFILFVGWMGAGLLPGLGSEGGATDRISLYMINLLAGEIPQFKFFMVIFLGAVIAAIMSTVDSALLTLSSSITEDWYRLFRPESSQARLTFLGKILSWLLMGAMALLAIQSESTIFRLIEIKLELLLQTVPAIYFGVHCKSLSGRSLFSGMVVGTAVTVVFLVAQKLGAPLPAKPLGIYAGVWGLGLNLAIVAVVENISRKSSILSKS